MITDKPYKVIAILRNEEEDVEIVWAQISFDMLAEGKDWIDSEEGDLFAESFNDEMRDGEKYEGYWLDDVIVSQLDAGKKEYGVKEPYLHKGMIKLGCS